MKRSAGVVLWRRRDGSTEVLLGHMGGPFWARKHAGAWTIPKGEVEPGEEPFDVAVREFAEEIGQPLSEIGDADVAVDLGEIRQSAGKVVRAWAVEFLDDTDLDPANIVSNTFTIEWPPRSGTMQAFPELDRAAWFDLVTAREAIVGGQRELLERLSGAPTTGR